MAEGAEMSGQSVRNQGGGSAGAGRGSEGILALEGACVVHRLTITPVGDEFGDACQLWEIS